MRGFKYAMSMVMTIFGTVYILLSVGFTLILIMQLPKGAALSIVQVILFLLMNSPPVLLLYFGQRIRKKLYAEQHATLPAQPMSFTPPEPRAIIKVKPTPVPAPKKTVSAECKGCGARMAIMKDEVSSCDYCGSPLSAGN
ncbi:hypothetical protein D3P07_15460 [Paenibacillus sp. 1011MAR3C5]|uniref:hypothetical protein n=1 Tax=Paenibacillus sp. 1011MAR3C5 TaxID=1675787 RepID=UPI000E6D0D68|nr:hypothetical protein [Paenibacillus sp. 1011MAR3C5]RJE87703.1 hypothetical protein D3P07_15460 [Paenibacillus sp. 1011MAR3C5]